MAQSQESALGIRLGSVASFEVNMSRRALMTAPEGQLKRLPTFAFYRTLLSTFTTVYVGITSACLME